VRGIERAARHDWRAAAFVLERRWPDRWGRERVTSSAEDELDDDWSPIVA
jgi:hypothetical protein